VRVCFQQFGRRQALSCIRAELFCCQMLFHCFPNLFS
jgi:hypothetical protein